MNAIIPASDSSKRNHSAFIDMTPMVDLGFLLITFFIFTSSMNEPRALRLIMPKIDGVPPDVKESHVATILLGKSNTIYYYEGFLEKALLNKTFIQTHFGKNGVREMIMEKKKKTGQELIILLKTSMECNYGNMVDAMDEIKITNVLKWMVFDASPEEQNLIRNH
jgi:biopolymer transport protein ExbD